MTKTLIEIISGITLTLLAVISVVDMVIGKKSLDTRIFQDIVIALLSVLYVRTLNNG